MLFRCLAISLALLLGLSSFTDTQDDISKLVAEGLRTGNASAVSKYFNPMVDLSLPGSDETYSKTQASQVLKKFFVQNPVKGFKISKQGSSADGSTYCIGTLDAGRNSYRVYYLIKPVVGKNLVQQLQIQENT
jgi:hypothetical protein